MVNAMLEGTGKTILESNFSIDGQKGSTGDYGSGRTQQLEEDNVLITGNKKVQK